MRRQLDPYAATEIDEPVRLNGHGYDSAAVAKLDREVFGDGQYPGLKAIVHRLVETLETRMGWMIVLLCVCAGSLLYMAYLQHTRLG